MGYMKTYKKAYITTLASVAFLIQSFLITIIEIQILKSDLVQHPSAIYGTKSVWDDNAMEMGMSTRVILVIFQLLLVLLTEVGSETDENEGRLL